MEMFSKGIISHSHVLEKYKHSGSDFEFDTRLEAIKDYTEARGLKLVTTNPKVTNFIKRNNIKHMKFQDYTEGRSPIRYTYVFTKADESKITSFLAGELDKNGEVKFKKTQRYSHRGPYKNKKVNGNPEQVETINVAIELQVIKKELSLIRLDLGELKSALI